jgi:hypothetical protein
MWLTQVALPTAADQRIGFIAAASMNGGTSTNYNAAVLSVMSEAAWTAGSSQPAYFRFETIAPSSTTLVDRLRITAKGNIVIGFGTGVLSTSATDGFLYVPNCAGAPSGAATSFTGSKALVYDSSNDQLGIYNGSWKMLPALGVANSWTAANSFSGVVGIGGASASSTWLNLAAGTTAKSQINLAASTAPTSPSNGDFWFDGTDVKIRVSGATKTFTLV